MRSPFVLTATVLLGCWLGFAQAGTNAAHSQQMTKPRTGNAANTVTSPDVNSAVTGTRGNTLGTSGDVDKNGTNGARSQEMAKPRTGRASEIITSPDVNSAAAGTRGNTLGTPGDVSSRGDAAVAGSGSAAAESTAAVSTREQMERESLRAREGQSAATTQVKPAEKASARPHGKRGAGSSHRNAETSGRSKNGPQR